MGGRKERRNFYDNDNLKVVNTNTFSILCLHIYTIFNNSTPSKLNSFYYHPRHLQTPDKCFVSLTTMRTELSLDGEPHTSRISCCSASCLWWASDSSTPLRWSSSSRWDKRPRASPSSLRDASACWLSAFSWAWECSFSLET